MTAITSSLSSNRFQSLDVLRGVAILFVMLLHYAERGIASGDAIIHARIWPLLEHGYLGVQLFFVISGYCITAAVYSALGRDHAFRFFMLRRIRRVIPPYWASLLVVIALGLATVFVLNTPSDVVFPLNAFDWLCNVFLVQELFHATNANLVYWSLSIEIQFYALMAMALLIPRRIEWWLILVTVLWLISEFSNSISTRGTIVAFWPQFVPGIVAYYWISGKARCPATPWILFFSVFVPSVFQCASSNTFFLSNGHIIWPLKSIFCLVCMFVLLTVHRGDAYISQWPISKALSFFGLISYSLYLTHVPVGTRVFNGVDRFWGLGGINWFICMAVALFAAGVLGYVFFFLFERPWINKHRSVAIETELYTPEFGTVQE